MCVKDPKSTLHIRRLTRRIRDSAYSCTHDKQLHSQIIRGKGIKGIQVHTSLRSVSSMRGHPQHIFSPGNENVTSAQGSPLETPCPRVLCHRGNLCLGYTKIQTPIRETGVPHKPQYLYKESRHSDSEKILGVQVSKC